MPKKLTHEEFINKLYNKNKKVTVLEKYQLATIKVKCQCTECDNIFYMRPSNLLNGQGCPECGKIKYKNANRNTLENFKSKLYNINKDIEIISDTYINNKTHVKCKCKICNNEWEARPDNLIHGYGCPKCAIEFKASKLRKSLNDFIIEANNVHNNKYDYSKVEYKSNDIKICIICPKHGEFYQTPGNHLQGHGCPKCNASRGETFVERYLIDNNIQYQRQFLLNINNKRLYVDFAYVYNGNFGLIEYNGRQHYMPVDYFGGQDIYEKQQKRDRLLKEFCLSSSITLIEIPYNLCNNQIIKYLNEYLNIENVKSI